MSAVKVLCVAEKPSISKSVASLLSRNSYQTRRGKDKYCLNYDFRCSFRGQPASVTMTAVLGHLMSIDFTADYRKWSSCDPIELFDADIVKFIPDDMKDVAKNLEIESRSAQHLVIWTDCDREGEHIGSEIVAVCRKSNPRLQVWRGRFSVIQEREIKRAMDNVGTLDMNQAEAVDARIELDLRIGAAFTRFQTLELQRLFPQLEQKVVSYGSCQFPTLGFVVDQYLKRQNFIVEPFWGISVKCEKEGNNVGFNWVRGHLFDRLACLILYEQCVENPIARVLKVESKPTSKWRPLPLTTVQLQKMASIYLRISSDKTMKIAEDLYNKGFISYPRTETDEFEKTFNLQEVVEQQVQHPTWGRYAQDLLSGKFQWPRKGKNNDHAHPPIHPTKLAADLQGDERKIYELVSRCFLACCSKDATGHLTTVNISIATELFSTSGLVVNERNYLEIYTYEKWNDNPMPQFLVGEEFEPSSCEMTEGKTSPPSLLTEACLISIMDQNGIGTDATIAEHIKKILDREYAFKENNSFIPSTLGLALVEGYDKIGLEQSLAKPNLRKAMEMDMKDICNGRKTRDIVVRNALRMYKDMFVLANEKVHTLGETLSMHLNGADIPSEQFVADETFENEEAPDLTQVSALTENQPNDTRPFSTSESRPSHSRQSNQQNTTLSLPNIQSSNTTNKPRCNCEMSLFATLKTVSKDGPTKGKMFWTCTRSANRCGFFMWDDETSATTPADPNENDPHRASNFVSGNRTSRAQSSSSTNNDPTCYKCGESGHFSSSCTSNERSSTTVPSKRSAETCFNCGKRGHFASSCKGKAKGSTSRARGSYKSQNGSKPQRKPRSKTE